MLPASHLKQINHDPHSWQQDRGGMEWQCEKGCSLCLIPFISESLLIIGSSFHHLAYPQPCHSALRGSWGVWRRGGARQQPPSGVNRTHMHTVHTSSFRSIKEKEITRAEEGNLKIALQSLIKATSVIWALTFFVIFKRINIILGLNYTHKTRRKKYKCD